MKQVQATIDSDIATSNQKEASETSSIIDDLDLGPLRELLDDESITDIMINGPFEVFAEQQGKLKLMDTKFTSHEQLERIANSIVAKIGRKIDPKRPYVDARLPDGSRVNIVAPPLALDGVSMSIRKFSKESITLDKMVASGCMTEQLAFFLKEAAKVSVNIIISGGTGSGKTTMLNAISQYAGEGDRVVTIEDSAELQLQLPHVVRLETKNPEIIGDATDEVSMRDLVKNSLRMRPDRVIIGEVRGAEAFDMIQAMNTGHDGSMATIHANTPRDGLARIMDMVGMANLNIPAASMRNQIASAVKFIIQTSRMEDGVRRVTYVTEILGVEADVVTMQDIFKYETNGQMVDGKLQGEIRWGGMFPRHKKLAHVLQTSGLFNQQIPPSMMHMN